MARLHYLSLPDVGPWNQALKQVGAQLRPYNDFLHTAVRAARSRATILAWRSAESAEAKEFNRRLDQQHKERNQRARRAHRRRDRHQIGRPQGVWVVLEAPPWRSDEPIATFDAFFDAEGVYDLPHFRRKNQLSVNAVDVEGCALLLSTPPASLQQPDDDQDELPSEQRPHGQLLWVAPNTYTLERQVDALRELESRPQERHAPLIRMLCSRATWRQPVSVGLEEDDWVFLKRDSDGGLRDGTDEQRRFVEVGLGTPDIALLDGPPGSGKTTAICELVTQLLRDGKRVLLVASTHVAVDNVLERLLEWQDESAPEDRLVVPVRIGDEARVTADTLRPFTLTRLKQTWRDELFDFFDEPEGANSEGKRARKQLRAALSESEVRGSSPLVQLILDASNLVCGTTIGILKHPELRAARYSGENCRPFDVMILDEASKTPFAEFLVPAMHARSWIIVGDIKQLSPYVEEEDLAGNVRGLVPPEQSSVALHAFSAGLNGGRLVRSLIACGTQQESERVRLEVEAREVLAVDLDKARGQMLGGVKGCVPELLYGNLIYGSPAALEHFEARLPADLTAEVGPTPKLAVWRRARKAWLRADRRGGAGQWDSDEQPDWASEVAWRLVRSFELRQNAAERRRLLEEIEALLPRSLDDDWYVWRKSRPQRRSDGAGDQSETPIESLQRELATLRRVAMPSILELLQQGFKRLPGWRDAVALTDGLPTEPLLARLVSLRFQHRMHPHISAFPREQFYTSSIEDSGAEQLDEPGLLLDASTMAADREWSYRRYARRALWIHVSPPRGKGVTNNSNTAEVDVVMKEIDAFLAWARTHPHRDKRGREGTWQLAALTFYRGQETLLRSRLQRRARQPGNRRNFYFGDRNSGGVHVTLGTVDSFQGHEADLVLLSTVKTRTPGFLNSPNRLCVAITRARFQLVLIGNRNGFADDKFRSPLLQSLARSEHYRGDIAWEESP